VTTSGLPESSETPVPALDEARAALASQCEAIEAAYEFMLGYAAQGLPAEPGGGSGSQIRTLLEGFDRALGELVTAISRVVDQRKITPREAYTNFIAVIGRDAGDARAAIQLALAQRSISSQLVDNLNASMHVRALLTDLFLIDEVLKSF
jgi:hypothetical protein